MHKGLSFQSCSRECCISMYEGLRFREGVLHKGCRDACRAPWQRVHVQARQAKKVEVQQGLQRRKGRITLPPSALLMLAWTATVPLPALPEIGICKLTLFETAPLMFDVEKAASIGCRNSSLRSRGQDVAHRVGDRRKHTHKCLPPRGRLSFRVEHSVFRQGTEQTNTLTERGASCDAVPEHGRRLRIKHHSCEHARLLCPDMHQHMYTHSVICMPVPPHSQHARVLAS